MAFLETDNYFLGLTDMQPEVVVSAPCCQQLHLSPIVSLVALGNETHRCCLVHKLNKMICAVCCSAVVCEQGEQQRTEHTALAGSCAQAFAA